MQIKSIVLSTNIDGSPNAMQDCTTLLGQRVTRCMLAYFDGWFFPSESFAQRQAEELLDVLLEHIGYRNCPDIVKVTLEFWK